MKKVNLEIAANEDTATLAKKEAPMTGIESIDTEILVARETTRLGFLDIDDLVRRINATGRFVAEREGTVLALRLTPNFEVSVLRSCEITLSGIVGKVGDQVNSALSAICDEMAGSEKVLKNSLMTATPEQIQELLEILNAKENIKSAREELIKSFYDQDTLFERAVKYGFITKEKQVVLLTDSYVTRKKEADGLSSLVEEKYAEEKREKDTAEMKKNLVQAMEVGLLNQDEAQRISALDIKLRSEKKRALILALNQHEYLEKSGLTLDLKYVLSLNNYEEREEVLDILIMTLEKLESLLAPYGSDPAHQSHSRNNAIRSHNSLRGRLIACLTMPEMAERAGKILKGLGPHGGVPFPN